MSNKELKQELAKDLIKKYQALGVEIDRIDGAR